MTSDKVTFEYRLKEEMAEEQGWGEEECSRQRSRKQAAAGLRLAHGGAMPLGTRRACVWSPGGAGQGGRQGHLRGDGISRTSPALSRTLLFTLSEMGSPEGLLSGDVMAHTC